MQPHTPENWEVKYKEIDTNLESEIQEILDAKPDVVAISALTARINETYHLATQLRTSGITVILGGLHVSALPHEASVFAHSIIQGEGEYLWPIVLRDVEKNQLKKIYSSLTHKAYSFNFTDCRIPQYELLDISLYNRLTLQTTRGCPLHCTFCAASRTISTYKKKSIRQVEKELNKIHEIWEKPFIELADDNTFVDKNWSYDLLKLFGRYKMKWFTETDISIAYNEELLGLLKESNCSQLLIGFESTTAPGLKGIDRNNWKYKQFDNYLMAIDKIQSYGISVNGCFILGFDANTPDTFAQTEQFIKDSNLSEVQITVLTPFPGTDLYTTLKKENRLLSDIFWDQCTLFDLTYRPKNMSVDEFENGFYYLMKAVYQPEEVNKRKRKFRQTVKEKGKEIKKYDEHL